jgi:hypothetical protein
MNSVFSTVDSPLSRILVPDQDIGPSEGDLEISMCFVGLLAVIDEESETVVVSAEVLDHLRVHVQFGRGVVVG